MEMLPILVVFVGAAYFLMIRPQQKRMREHQSQVDALQPGDRVILNSGMFATISHIAATQAIVELAPGVEVTILKQVIARVAQDNEEEFEFTDEAEETLDGEQETPGDEEAVDAVDAPGPEDADAAEKQEPATTDESVSEKN